LTPKNVNKVY